jgi:hypothetical protein
MPDLRKDDNQKFASLTEEKTNNDLGYSFRYAEHNLNNTQLRTHMLIMINGTEKTATEWAKKWGVTKSTVHSRIKHGFPLSRLTANSRANAFGRVPNGTYSDSVRCRKSPEQSPPQRQIQFVDYESRSFTLPAYHRSMYKLFPYAGVVR